jgi:hypothetical protein
MSKGALGARTASAVSIYNSNNSLVDRVNMMDVGEEESGGLGANGGEPAMKKAKVEGEIVS